MRRSWCSSVVVAATLVAAQAPNYRVTYRLRLVERVGSDTRLLATGVVSGPPETALRLSLRAGPAELQALLGTLPEPDTVNLAGVFFSRRAAGRSRRGLPLWEEDSYRRWARLAWGGTARLDPFGAARGRVTVTLDADLQNDPADIPALLDELARSGAAAVVGYRVDRRDSGWKRLQSRIANGVRNRLNRETIRDTGCSLKAFRADAARELPLFNGMHRFLPTLIKMQGGRVTEVPVRHRPRRFGKTKYGMWNRVFRSLADAFAVRWMQRRALRYRVREELP